MNIRLQEFVEHVIKDSIVKRVEIRDNIAFMLGDNMNLLRFCKEEMYSKLFHYSIDDPPYGINVTKMKLGDTAGKFKSYNRKGNWDSKIPTKEYFDLVNYICRDHILWGGNYFTHLIDWSGRGPFVWDKKNDGTDLADCEVALSTIDQSARIIRRARNSKGGEVRKIHPTQKPVYVYDFMYLNGVEKNKNVYDGHGGSFNHAIASYKNGGNLVIIDADETYFTEGLKNFDEFIKAPRFIFD